MKRVWYDIKLVQLPDYILSLTPSLRPQYERRLKRYRYLLGQTELFAHFLNLKAGKDEALRKVLDEQKIGKSTEEGYAAFGHTT